MLPKRKFTSAEETFAEWHKDPEYVREYEALETEFALVSAMIAARVRTGLTQAEPVERLGMKRSEITRLGSGRGTPSAILEKLA